MFSQGNGYSLSDIAAVSGANQRGNERSNDSGFGDGAWWIVVLFLFIFCGWGNGGFGGFGGGGASGALTRADLCQDMNFSDLENGVRGLQSGLCDGFYAMNTSMLNGFAGVQSSLCQGFAGVTQGATQNTNAITAAINADTVANMQNTNALMAQLNGMSATNQACCCETQREIAEGFANLNYNLATQECQTRQTVSDSARDIIDNQNAGVRSILDFLTQDKIATLTAENQSLKFAASQSAQNAYLVNELAPKLPVPAYTVPNPFVPYGYGYGCGCNCGNAAIA